MNPILDFGIDKSTLQYVGYDLQRPECILAEPDGVLCSADARGGVMRIAPDGSQRIVTQKRSQHFEGQPVKLAATWKALYPTVLRSRAPARSSSRTSVPIAWRS
jgi:hypothetical protein